MIEPGKINPNVPKALERICLKALKKDKEERYPSAEAFVTSLTRFEARFKEQEKSERRNKKNSLWKGIAAGMLALLIFIVWLKMGKEEVHLILELKGTEILEKGEKGNYTIILRNVGKKEIRGVTLKVKIPDGLEYKGQKEVRMTLVEDAYPKNLKEVIAIKEGRWSIEAEVKVEGNEYIWKKSLAVEVKKAKFIYDLPDNVWESCRYQLAKGEEILDMASEYWCNLSVSDQQSMRRRTRKDSLSSDYRDIHLGVRCFSSAEAR